VGIEKGSGGQQAQSVRCLSFHADYGCQNSGACCSSGWEVAVETRVELGLRSRLRSGVARLPNGPDGFRPAADPPSGCRSALRLHEPSGSCWFRDDEARRCAIHREFGWSALPAACQQFPRVCVLEPDSVSISLSHYCPTAAGLLFRQEGGFDVVQDPPAFPRSWPFEGLDARFAHPPFLRPRVLLGFDGLRTFEEEAIAALSEPPVFESLGRIEQATRAFRAWRPALGPLVALIRASFRNRESFGPGLSVADPRSVLSASLPRGSAGDRRLPVFSDAAPTFPPMVDLALRRYLAARLIAAWIMFQAEDIAAVVRYLRLCLDTVLLFRSMGNRDEARVEPWKEAIRSADLWLLHHCDPDLLARNLG